MQYSILLFIDSHITIQVGHDGKVILCGFKLRDLNLDTNLSQCVSYHDDAGPDGTLFKLP